MYLCVSYYEDGQDRGGTVRGEGSGKVEKPRGGEVSWGGGGFVVEKSNKWRKVKSSAFDRLFT